MANTDYRNDELTIRDMVFNRLRFLDSSDQATIGNIDNFIYEVMWELESCFNIATDANGIVDNDRVGQEENYSILQQSIIADIVCTYVLLYTVGQNIQGDATTGSTPTLKFLKRTKAGSAEVEWGQFVLKDAVGLLMNADGLIKMYTDSASRRMRAFGCVFDICTDCTGTLDGVTGIMPMLNVQDCGCGK